MKRINFLLRILHRRLQFLVVHLLHRLSSPHSIVYYVVLHAAGRVIHCTPFVSPSVRLSVCRAQACYSTDGHNPKPFTGENFQLRVLHQHTSLNCAHRCRGHLRSAAWGDLAVSRPRTTSYGQRCFAVFGPTLRNSHCLFVIHH